MKKSKALITGIAGFAGSYLAEFLLLRGISVSGLLAPGEKTDNIKPIQSGLELERFSILNEKKLAAYIKKVKPDYIFHLAALASVGKSFNNFKPVYDVNVAGSMNLFEAATTVKNLKKFVFVSTSDVYGIVKLGSKSLDENYPLNPVSPYAISKAAGEFMARYYFRNKKLPVVISRSFNHTGPKQTDSFVIPSFCKQVARIEAGKSQPVMKVGDLSAKRDFSDVRDIVRGYYLMAQKGKPGEVYHLCSGKAVSVKSVLDKLIKISGCKIKVTVDKDRLRKSDLPILKGNNKKAVKELGWENRISLDSTIKQTLDYWREKFL